MSTIAPRHKVSPMRAVHLAPASLDRLPRWCDIVVEEQDRWLVLGEDTQRREDDPERWARELDGTPLEQLLDAAVNAEPVAGGSVLLRQERPLRLLAVVRDLEARQTVREDWVREALETVLRITARTSVRGIALPVLGGQHEIDAAEPFGDLLAELMRSAGPARLRIALLAERGVTLRVAAAMRESAPDLVVRCAA
ncbi:MAG TPA: hypothetical protein VLA56_12930 [Pseudomonadales bacterium]|nr:hypothetical protein [Pseudomonadales bacterium]